MRGLFILITCSCCAIVVWAVDEMQCSRYHYEEQILSKQIRMEIRLEDLEKKVDAMRQSNVNPTCDDEWITFKSFCYLFGRVGLDFQEAENFCQLYNAHLVSIHNQEESDFIARHVSELSAPDYWIGMADVAQEGLWKWIDTNENVRYFNWNAGEPNGGRNENYGLISKNQNTKWIDVSGTNRNNRPICKK